LREGFRQRVFSQSDFDGDFSMVCWAQEENFGLYDGGSGGCTESFVIQQKPEECLGIEQELHAM
jgi:hypothetical protein